MKWRYYFVHRWDRPRLVWEDIYLAPDMPGYDGPSIWLTIDALGDEQDPSHGSDRAEAKALFLSKLGDQDYHIDGTDMIVRARDFDRAELLRWVRIWLNESGLQVTQLVRGTLEDFAGSNDHAEIVAQLKARYGEAQEG